MHILGLGQRIKKSLIEAGITGYQFGTVGVSDGISMGTRGMSYSLQSRDLIADQVETAAGGHWLDGMVVVPGCDKNMPGVLMARKSHEEVSVETCLTYLSREAEPAWIYGVRWDHSTRLVRKCTAARHCICIPIVWKVSAGRADGKSRKRALRHHSSRLSRRRGLRRYVHRKHYGQCSGSTRHDLTWILLLPGRIP